MCFFFCVICVVRDEKRCLLRVLSLLGNIKLRRHDIDTSWPLSVHRESYRHSVNFTPVKTNNSFYLISQTPPLRSIKLLWKTTPTLIHVLYELSGSGEFLSSYFPCCFSFYAELRLVVFGCASPVCTILGLQEHQQCTDAAPMQECCKHTGEAAGRKVGVKKKRQLVAMLHWRYWPYL